MTYKSFLLVVCIATAGILASCKGSKNTQTTTTVTYTNTVKAIVDANCGNACHNASKPAAGINLTTYENVRKETLNGQLIPAIQHAEGVDPMPKMRPQLDEASINAIVAWAN
ncbi:MAG: hypothetical protein R2794_04380 [Chitinophagales bacterium]